MNERIGSKRFIFFFVLMILTVFACQFLGSQGGQYPSTIGTFQETGSYTINPKTILESLDRGDINAFTPIVATPNPNTPLLPSGSVPWTQFDYLKIANAMSQFVWKETLEDWKVYSILFNRGCQDNPVGFDSLDIIYYKTIKVNWQKVYTARYIQIYPLASDVTWGGGTNFPVSDGWNAVNLTEFNITADGALRIAEKNGGEEARLRVNNECSILVGSPNHNNDDSWDVGYYYGVNFELIINPYSGIYEIPTPSP